MEDTINTPSEEVNVEITPVQEDGAKEVEQAETTEETVVEPTVEEQAEGDTDEEVAA
jgi:hypothetical protein